MRLLSDKTIRLRGLEPEDLDLLYSVENSPELWEISSTLTPFSKALLKRYIDNAHLDLYEAKQLRLIIADFDLDKALGIIDLFDFDPMHHRAGVGLLVLEKYRNQGIAQKALKVFVNYAFEHLDLHQLYANILSDNQQSIKLFQKLNFERIGTKRDWIKSEGNYKNVEFYQLIRQH